MPMISTRWGPSKTSGWRDTGLALLEDVGLNSLTDAPAVVNLGAKRGVLRGCNVGGPDQGFKGGVWCMR